MTCHDAPHGSTAIIPVSPGPVKVHKKHNRLGYLPQEKCKKCHKPSDLIQCSDCHGNHTEQITTETPCIECHESLPTPFGHSIQREQFKAGNHSWMLDCSACHTGRNLKFEDIMVVPINNSLPLCSVCHSQQYKEMKSDDHGKSSDTCIYCHNPHDTEMQGGSNFSIETPRINASGILIEIRETPIIGNPLFLIIFFVIVFSIVYEYKFATPEKGKVLMADNIRLNAIKEYSKALEIFLAGPETEAVKVILREIENKNVQLIGMTMKAEPSMVVMFLDFSNTDATSEDLLDSLTELKENVVSAEYSEKYEI